LLQSCSVPLHGRAIMSVVVSARGRGVAHTTDSLSFTQSTDNSQELDSRSSSSRRARHGVHGEIAMNYGYIECLSISNFKSYFGETVIGPFSDFTCIIGPNGSGKSNLMDAISFVLGIKTQQLRGKKLTDLIHRINFSQSSRSSASNKSQPTQAYVELIYVSRTKPTKSRDDEEEHEEEEEHEVEEGEFEQQRMIFRRTISSEGHTINEYNGKRLAFKEYEEYLEQIGVIVRARNFLVFQGDVTNIAQKTGKQLTKWFEQISGSDQFKAEYDEARKEQEQVSNNYEAINERNRNLAKEKKQMRQQKDEANVYKETQRDLHTLKSKYYRFQLYHMLNDVSSAQRNIQLREEEMQQTHNALKDLEDDVKLKQADLSKSLRQKTSICKHLKARKTALSKKKLKAVRLEKQRESLQSEQQRTEEDEVKMEEVIEEKNEKLIELKQEESALNEERANYEEELKAETTEIELEENQYEIYKQITNQIRKECASINTQKRNLQSVYVRKQDAFDGAQKEIEILTQRKHKLVQSIENQTASIAALREEEKESATKYSKYSEQCEQLTAKQAELEKSRIDCNRQLEAIHNEVREMEIGMRESKKEKQELEILQTLQKLFTGIYGRLCDLVTVRQKRYNLAVAVALGLNHNAVVVENKHIAKKCIEHMRKTRRGHFRFIPLSDIKAFAVSQQLQRFGGTAQPIMNVLNYEPQFERAVQFALSNTVVVDAIDEARHIAYNLSSAQSQSQSQNHNGFDGGGNASKRIRVVSLDGSIIQPNGNISGGFSMDFKDKARRFNEKERAKKIKKRDELIAKLKHMEDQMNVIDDDEDEEEEDERDEEEDEGRRGKRGRSLQELQSLLVELENRRKNLQFQIETYTQQLREKERMLASLEKEMKSKKGQLLRAEKEANGAKQQLDECDAKLIEKEQEIFSEVAEQLGVGSIREYEEQKLQRIEERSERRKEMNAKLTEIQNKYSFIESQNRQNVQERKALRARLKKIRKELSEIEENTLKSLKAEIEEEEKAANEEEKKADDIQEDCKLKRKAVADTKKQIDAKRKEITEKMHKKNELRGWIARLSQTQKNIMQQAKHEQVDLKDERASKKKKKKGSKKQRGSPKRGRAGHRRKRRKKNDGDSSDEQESDDLPEEEEEEHKTEDEDLSDNQMDQDEEEEEEDDDEDDDDDVDQIQERMRRRMSGIDLSEFGPQRQPRSGRRRNVNHNRNGNNAMDVDDEEQEEEQEEEATAEEEEEAGGEEEYEYEAKKKEFVAQIEEITNRLQEYQPNMKALDQYKKLQSKWKDGNTEWKEYKKRLTAINNRVDEITEKRSKRFMHCFDIVCKNIKSIYGELTKSAQYKSGGKAFLDIGAAQSNPFDDEIIFNAMPPGKPFREMQQLSGGEKSVASLALLFAIHSYKPSPFFILDEIDAALDQRNVQRVCNYIQHKSKHNTQIIVISLKDKFFSFADSLIGVCKDRRDGGDSSMVLSIDLTKYAANHTQRRERERPHRREDDEKQQQL